MNEKRTLTERGSIIRPSTAKTRVFARGCMLVVESNKHSLLFITMKEEAFFYKMALAIWEIDRKGNRPVENSICLN